MKPTDLDRSRDLLLGCQSPLLLTHIAPDGDAIGSLLGLGWALRVLGKQPALACRDALPAQFDYLPGFHDVTSEVGKGFDLLVTLDCSDEARIGEWDGPLPPFGVPLLNIDHHLTNTRFGTVNLVDETAVATAHILCHLIPLLGVAIDERIALCLLTGVVTDTRGFRTPNITSEVLRMAADLLDCGASLPLVIRNGLEQRSLNVLRLWGLALSQLQMSDGIVWVKLSLAAQRAAGCEGYGGSGLSNLLISAAEADVTVVLVEREDGQVEVGFRAVPGLDVSRIAFSLGGGGHALASGCLVPGPLDEAEWRVLSLLREEMAQQRRAAEGDGRHPQSG